jgi:hypothetical protein
MPYDKSYDLIGYDETGKEVIARHTVVATHWYVTGDEIENSGSRWLIVRVRNTSTEALRLVDMHRIQQT